MAHINISSVRKGWGIKYKNRYDEAAKWLEARNLKVPRVPKGETFKDLLDCAMMAEEKVRRMQRK